MRLQTTDPHVRERVRNEALLLTTVKELKEYTFNAPSPIVGELLAKAIRFFQEECQKPDGKRDWKAIKLRKQMGLRYQLQEGMKLTGEICEALRSWMLHPHYGRNIGTDFGEAMLSQKFGISDPRNYVHDLLSLIGEKQDAPPV